MVEIEKCVFVPSGGALGFPLRRTRADTVRVLFRSFAFFWVVSGFVFGFLCILFVYLEVCLHFPWVVSLGFLCILEALCVLVLVYLEALSAFFWYTIL